MAEGTDSWLDASQADAFRVSRAELLVHSLNFAENEVVALFVGDGDYTALEAEQAVESQPTQDADEAEVNQQMRWLKLVGMYQPHSGRNITEPTVMKLNHTFEPEKGLKYFVYNFGGAMSSAAQAVTIFAKYFGVWVRS